MTAAKTTPQTDQPYCSNCGYILAGLTESAKCPECGRPLVEVLTRAPKYLEIGKRYRSEATLFGLPVIDIALGPKRGELRGRACGIIAIGDIATGWLAMGGLARGIVAIGGLSCGIFSIGGMSAGLLTAIGGCAIGSFATGGLAIGIMANGGCAIGLFAQGAVALGWYARAANPIGTYTMSFLKNSSPEATEMFHRLRWFFGTWPASPWTMLRPLTLLGGITALFALLIGGTAAAASRDDDS